MTDARLREIAENAVSFLYDVGLLDEFLEDRYIDFDADDYAYFGLEDEFAASEDENEDEDDFYDFDDEDEDDESDEPTDEPVSEVDDKSMKEITEYFNSCVNYWWRNGDPTSIAVCKALWWDCAEVWNIDRNWTPARRQFFNNYRQYEPYGPLPEAEAVEKGMA